MTHRRLLISYAHPDDESFGLGALIAKAVAEGVDVYLICATNGEAGTVKPEFIERFGSIKAVRLAELACASQYLGFKQVFLLGYRDSGMMGDADNDHPESLWQAPLDAVTQRVVQVMRQVQPQVVLTFNEYGGYGHPDHIKIQQATVKAFHAAGEAAYEDGAGLAPFAPQKLYYSSIPASMIRLGVWQTRLRGKNPRKLGVNGDIDIVKILDYAQPATTLIPVAAYFDAWQQASACHASQGGGSTGSIPRWARHWFMPNQGFTRVLPPVIRAGIVERDLFDNVRAEALSPAAATTA